MFKFQISDSCATTETKQLTSWPINSFNKWQEAACFSLHLDTESAGQAHSAKRFLVVVSSPAWCNWKKQNKSKTCFTSSFGLKTGSTAEYLMIGKIQKYTGKPFFFYLVFAAAIFLVSSATHSGPLVSMSSLLKHQDAPLDLFVPLFFCLLFFCLCLSLVVHAPGHNNTAATWPSLRLCCLFLGSEEESWLI